MMRFLKYSQKINSFVNKPIFQKKTVSNFQGSHRPDNDFENFIWFVGGFACGYLIHER